MKDYSQNGESTIVKELFDSQGVKDGFFFDIGAGDGYNPSNTRMFRNMGWEGFMYDPNGINDVIRQRITVDNVLDELVWPTPFIDLLSVGDDYVVLREILDACDPSVVICQINAETERLFKSHGYIVYDVNNHNMIATKFKVKPRKAHSTKQIQ